MGVGSEVSLNLEILRRGGAHQQGLEIRVEEEEEELVPVQLQVFKWIKEKVNKKKTVVAR